MKNDFWQSPFLPGAMPDRESRLRGGHTAGPQSIDNMVSSMHQMNEQADHRMSPQAHNHFQGTLRDEEYTGRRPCLLYTSPSPRDS